MSRDIGPKSNIQAQRFRSIVVRSKFSELRVGYSDEEIKSEKGEKHDEVLSVVEGRTEFFCSLLG